MNDMLLDNDKIAFRNISKSLNKYVEKKDFIYIDEIENILKEIFDTEYIKFSNYHEKEKNIEYLNIDEKCIIHLEGSLLAKAVSTQLPILVNHIISDKYFVPEIDNPLNLKVKSLIIFPIIINKNVIGIVNLWKGMRERSVFTKNDLDRLAFFSPLFVNIIQSKMIDKKELLDFIH